MWIIVAFFGAGNMGRQTAATAAAEAINHSGPAMFISWLSRSNKLLKGTVFVRTWTAYERLEKLGRRTSIWELQNPWNGKNFAVIFRLIYRFSRSPVDDRSRGMNFRYHRRAVHAQLWPLREVNWWENYDGRQVQSQAGTLLLRDHLSWHVESAIERRDQGRAW